MTKLVDILANELTSWPDDGYRITQDGNGDTATWPSDGILSFSSHPSSEQWVIKARRDGVDWLELLFLENEIEVAEDYSTAIITKEMWEAARMKVENEEVKEETDLRYNVGDVVVLADNVDQDWGKNFTPGKAVEVTELCLQDSEEDRHYTVKTNGKVWWIRDFEIDHEVTEKLNTSAPVPHTTEVERLSSNESAPFTTIFTSISCVRKKDVAEVSFQLYDESATTISLDDDAGGMYIRIQQDCDGELQYIKLDLDEIKPVFEAIQKLISQDGVTSVTEVK